jgi:hypothetical protein
VNGACVVLFVERNKQWLLCALRAVTAPATVDILYI